MCDWNEVKIIEAEAPEGLDGLPLLDVVLIGGSGSNLQGILTKVNDLLKIGGKIVLNCITVQTLFSCLDYMKKTEEYVYDTVQVQVNHWEQVGPYDMAKSNNPIFIVTCTKVDK